MGPLFLLSLILCAPPLSFISPFVLAPLFRSRRPLSSPSTMSSASTALIPLAPLHRFSAVNGARRSFLCHRNPWRTRVFMSVSVGSRATVGNDALFQDYKPSCAFLFPGQVIRFRPSLCELVALFGFFHEVLIVTLRKATVEIFVNDRVKMRDVMYNKGSCLGIFFLL